MKTEIYFLSYIVLTWYLVHKQVDQFIFKIETNTDFVGVKAYVLLSNYFEKIIF